MESEGQLNQSEERISECEDKTMGSIEYEEAGKKRLKKSEENQRYLCNTMKKTNTCNVGVPEEGREREMFEELMAAIFPNLKKHTDINIKETQQIPNRINSMRLTVRKNIINYSCFFVKGQQHRELRKQ